MRISRQGKSAVTGGSIGATIGLLFEDAWAAMFGDASWDQFWSDAHVPAKAAGVYVALFIIVNAREAWLRYIDKDGDGILDIIDGEIDKSGSHKHSRRHGA